MKRAGGLARSPAPLRPPRPRSLCLLCSPFARAAPSTARGSNRWQAADSAGWQRVPFVRSPRLVEGAEDGVGQVALARRPPRLEILILPLRFRAHGFSFCFAPSAPPCSSLRFAAQPGVAPADPANALNERHRAST